MRKKRIVASFGFALVIGLMVMGCPTETTETPAGGSGISGAETPVITTQPLGMLYKPAAAIQPLTVAATVSDGGKLSYQWYKNTTNSNRGGIPVGSATADPAYTPVDTAAGIYWYYVDVINTHPELGATKRTSNAAPVQISSADANLSVILENSDAVKKQYIRGIGGMSNQNFIYGNGAWIDNMTVSNIQSMFGHGAQELGLNMYRLLMYPYLEEGIEYTGPQGALIPGDPDQGIVDNTSLYRPGPNGGGTIGSEHDESDYYDIVKKVNELGGYVMLCPWILPLEFTRNAASTGPGTGIGNGTYVDETKLEELAEWYLDYLRNMIDKGAPVFAISFQNEPDMGVAYDGCRWAGNTQRDFIRIFGPKLEASGMKGYGGGKQWDKIWLSTGDNAGLPTALGDAVINDVGPTGASQYTEIATRHNYGGMQPYTNGVTAIFDPDDGKGLREIWMTEHCDTTSRQGNTSARYDTMSQWRWVWHFANEVYNGFVNNNESAFIWWSSKRFYGYLGDGTQTTTRDAVLPRGHVAAHFSKYITDTNLINVTGIGNFVSNEGVSAAAGSTNLGSTSLMVTADNFNPPAFANGNSDTGGQNQPTTKVLAVESVDGSSISVIAFTPTRNSDAGGQNAGQVLVNLPAGFVASSAEIMRSNDSVKQQVSPVSLIDGGTAAVISLPRSEIVSVKFVK